MTPEDLAYSIIEKHLRAMLSELREKKPEGVDHDVWADLMNFYLPIYVGDEYDQYVGTIDE
jgi:hypothetical protein